MKYDDKFSLFEICRIVTHSCKYSEEIDYCTMDRDTLLRVGAELKIITDKELLMQKLECLFESEVEDRDKIAQAATRTDHNISLARTALAREFWIDISFALPHIDTRGFAKQLNCRRRNNQRKYMTRRGLKRRCRVMEIAAAPGDVNQENLVRYPFIRRGNFVAAIKHLQELQWQLKDVVVNVKEATKNKKRRGYSLAKTVVTGGSHACRDQEIRGSIHWNPTLISHALLQQNVFQVIGSVLKESFGQQEWYRSVRKYYESNPHLKDILIPETPCTSLWWCHDGLPFEHFHWNTVDIVFLFCAADLEGRNMYLGKIIAGQWWQCKHMNESFLSEVGGFSMLAYFDTRIIGKHYSRQFEEHLTEIL
jgi:hypothetical protein